MNGTDCLGNMYQELEKLIRKFRICGSICKFEPCCVDGLVPTGGFYGPDINSIRFSRPFYNCHLWRIHATMFAEVNATVREMPIIKYYLPRSRLLHSI